MVTTCAALPAPHAAEAVGEPAAGTASGASDPFAATLGEELGSDQSAGDPGLAVATGGRAVQEAPAKDPLTDPASAALMEGMAAQVVQAGAPILPDFLALVPFAAEGGAGQGQVEVDAALPMPSAALAMLMPDPAANAAPAVSASAPLAAPMAAPTVPALPTAASLATALGAVEGLPILPPATGEESRPGAGVKLDALVPFLAAMAADPDRGATTAIAAGLPAADQLPATAAAIQAVTAPAAAAIAVAAATAAGPAAEAADIPGAASPADAGDGQASLTAAALPRPTPSLDARRAHPAGIPPASEAMPEALSATPAAASVPVAAVDGMTPVTGKTPSQDGKAAAVPAPDPGIPPPVPGEAAASTAAAAVVPEAPRPAGSEVIRPVEDRAPQMAIASTPAPVQAPVPATPSAAPAVPVANPMEQAVVRQVRNALVQHLPDGGDRLVVRLTPPELGTVRIEIVHRDGAITARLMAEDEGVRRSLDRLLPSLRAEVRAADLPRVDVTLGDRPGAQENAFARPDQHGRQAQAQADGRRRPRADEPAFAIDGVAAAESPIQPQPRTLGGRAGAAGVDARA